MTTVRELLEEGVERFERAGLSYGHGTTNALDEAAWLILHAAKLPLTDLNANLDRVLTPTQSKAARDLISRRIRTRKPAAYLTNEAWLGKHRFYVDERVIVPRSYIFELIMNGTLSPTLPQGGGSKASLSLGRGQGEGPFRILDLCTGSGCLAILAALGFPHAKVDAADLSDDALEVAKRNVADYRLGRRVKLVKSDMFSALEGRTYDLIVSNPPYVKAASMKKLPDEYRNEPEMALASGRDGLDHTRVILSGAKRHLNPGGQLMVEIGHNRKALEKAFPALPFEWPRLSGGTGFVFVLSREVL
jgi:ribosomal protein L3 glutamine methyltransferase